MQLTRYYEKQPIEIVHIRAIRDILVSKQWSFGPVSYALYYDSEFVSVDTIDDATLVAKERGQPAQVRVSWYSTGGRNVEVETRQSVGFYISVDNKSDSAEEILAPIEATLSLKRYGEVPRGRVIATAFIAHAFNDDGQNCANEVARFLGLLGIRAYSGRAFAPTGVSEKVKSRMARHDIVIAIITSQDDVTWIQQEMSFGMALGKDLIILKQADAEFKAGLLGDHEYVSFPPKEISKTFIPILEGLNELCGIDPGSVFFGSSKKDSKIPLFDGNL